MNGMIGYRTHGTGPVTIFFLHEWLAAHENYLPMLSYFDERRVTCVLADLRGYGLSRHLTGDYSADEAAEDVLRLADALAVERFVLVGHSMSGMIAQRAAADAPERILRLVLISPIPASGFKTGADGFGRMAAIIADEAAAAEAIRARTGGRYGAAWIARKLALMRAGTHPDALLGYLRMFTATDFSADVAGLQLPVRILLGAHDIAPYREPAVTGAFAPLYPRLSIETSREAGHYMMLETPVWTASRIEQFLEAA
jgi:pimeloyl-ACP methyl ester carboxylesterase